MNKYEITVKETCEATYIIEANSPAEASELFDAWQEEHQSWISDDLLDNCFGWEFSEAVPAPDNSFVDVTYNEAKKCLDDGV